jgi:formylglycine-generating enzyme required for sulfatase activity
MLAAASAGASAQQPSAIEAARAAAAAGKPVSERTFRDCADCPEMIVIPAGSFLMGKPFDPADEHPEWLEKERKKVTLPDFAIGRFEVTRAQYARFVAETKRPIENDCFHLRFGKSGMVTERTLSWQAPGFQQGDDHPAVCISLADARDYVAWLSTKVPGGGYRLPTGAEWEYAARAGIDKPVWWSEAQDICVHANVADASFQRTDNKRALACDDGYAATAPVGLPGHANAFGLSDTIGNAEELISDCFNPEMNQCGRSMRGGDWASTFGLDVWSRNGAPRDARGAETGLRVVRDLNPIS